jgi:hypothetical protein
VNIAALLIQLISGAAGGNAAGSLLKQFSLGPVGNSILGLIGGGVGGQLVHMLAAGGMGSAAAATGGLDLTSIVSNIAGGGVGGGILMIIVGLIKSKMAPSSR